MSWFLCVLRLWSVCITCVVFHLMYRVSCILSNLSSHGPAGEMRGLQANSSHKSQNQTPADRIHRIADVKLFLKHWVSCLFISFSTPQLNINLEPWFTKWIYRVQSLGGDNDTQIVALQYITSSITVTIAHSEGFEQSYCIFLVSKK